MGILRGWIKRLRSATVCTFELRQSGTSANKTCSPGKGGDVVLCDPPATCYHHLDERVFVERCGGFTWTSGYAFEFGRNEKRGCVDNDRVVLEDDTG